MYKSLQGLRENANMVEAKADSDSWRSFPRSRHHRRQTFANVRFESKILRPALPVEEAFLFSLFIALTIRIHKALH